MKKYFLKICDENDVPHIDVAIALATIWQNIQSGNITGGLALSQGLKH